MSKPTEVPKKPRPLDESPPLQQSRFRPERPGFYRGARVSNPKR